MPEETGAQQTQTGPWPLVRFAFSVQLGSIQLDFQEVTGLSSETQVIEYRGGISKVYSTVKMPGIQKFSNVTLKKGIFIGDTVLWTDVYNKIQMNLFERLAVTINLLNYNAEIARTWTLTNAFPTKITVTDMKADANEVAIETLELAHEGLKMAK